MAIRFTKYVDITSGVGGGAAVRERDLITRLFTTNPLLPTGTMAEFDTADDVGSYFGFSSAEYLRAAFYFSWISKNTTRAKKISFARWADAATAPMVFGAPGDQLLATWTAIANGSFILTMGETTQALTGLDFTVAASLAAVATVIQTAIRAITGGGALWTSAVVTYDATRKCFNLEGGATGVATVSVSAGVTGTNIAGLLGWLTGAILSNGSAAQTVTEVLADSADASNNFATFLFMPALSEEEILEAATWNATQNVLYMFLQGILAADASDLFDLLEGFAGTGLTVSPVNTEYPEMIPGIILAATNYSQRSAVQNYMFQQFNVTPSVTTTTESNALDAVRANYYGRTQTAGQFLDFYQRGTLMGGATAPVDMNTYANEIWLKDAAGAAIMSLLLSLGRVSANSTGSAQLLTTLQSVVDRALFNGTISVGKTLNNTQKVYIQEQTGDPLAYLQVQNAGYWMNVVMESRVAQNDAVEWVAVYRLIYSKDDAVRKVEGTHTLI